MAIALRAIGSLATADSGDLTPTLPAGIQAGDILVLSMTARDLIAVTLPAGWTISEDWTSGALFHAVVAWKRATSSESDPTITRPAGSSACARIAAFSGCVESGSPINVRVQRVNGSVSTNAPGNTLTPTVIGCALVKIVHHNRDTVSAYTPSDARTTPVEVFDDAFVGTTFAALSMAWSPYYGLAALGSNGSTLATGSISVVINMFLAPSLEASIEGSRGDVYIDGSEGLGEVSSNERSRAGDVASSAAGIATLSPALSGTATLAAQASASAAGAAILASSGAARGVGDGTGGISARVESAGAARAAAAGASTLQARAAGVGGVASAAAPSPGTVTSESNSRGGIQAANARAATQLQARAIHGSAWLYIAPPLTPIRIGGSSGLWVVGVAGVAELGARAFGRGALIYRPWLSVGSGIRVRMNFGARRKIDEVEVAIRVPMPRRYVAPLEAIRKIDTRPGRKTSSPNESGAGSSKSTADLGFVSVESSTDVRAEPSGVGEVSAWIYSRSILHSEAPEESATSASISGSGSTVFSKADGVASLAASLQGRGDSAIAPAGVVYGSAWITAGGALRGAPVGVGETGATAEGLATMIVGERDPPIVINAGGGVLRAQARLSSVSQAHISAGGSLEVHGIEAEVPLFASIEARAASWIGGTFEASGEVEPSLRGSGSLYAAANGVGSIGAWAQGRATAWWLGMAISGACGATLYSRADLFNNVPAALENGTAEIQLRNASTVCENKATVRVYTRCPDYTPLIVFEFRAIGAPLWLVGGTVARPAHGRRVNSYLEITGLAGDVDYEFRVRVLDLTTGTKQNTSDAVETPRAFRTAPVGDTHQLGTRNVLSGPSMDAFALPGDPLSGLVTRANPRQSISLARRNGGSSAVDVAVYGTDNVSGKPAGLIERFDSLGLVPVIRTVTAQPTKSVSSVNTGTDRINSSNHGLQAGQPFTIQSTGSYPAPLVAGVTYYVANTTTGAFQVETSPGAGVLDLTTSGSGTITIKLPDQWSASNHGYIAGQPFELQTTGTLPAPFVPGTTYFVVQASTSTFKLSATKGGAAIIMSSAGTGAHNVWATGKLYADHWLASAISDFGVQGSVIGLEGFDGLVATYYPTILSALQAAGGGAGYVPRYDGGGVGVNGSAWGCVIGGNSATEASEDAVWNVGGSYRCVNGISIVGVDMRPGNLHPDKWATLSTANVPAIATGEPCALISYGSALGGCANILHQNIKIPSVPGNITRVTGTGAKSNSLDTSPTQFAGALQFYDCEFRAFREHFGDVSVTTFDPLNPTVKVADYSNIKGFGTDTHLRFNADASLDIRRSTFSYADEHATYTNGIGTALSGVRDQVFLTLRDRPGVLGSTGAVHGFGRPVLQWTMRCNPDAHKPSGGNYGVYHNLFTDANAACDYADGAASLGHLFVEDCVLNGQYVNAANGTGVYGFYGYQGPITIKDVTAGFGGGLATRCDIKGHYMHLGTDGFAYGYSDVTVENFNASGLQFWDAALEFESCASLLIVSMSLSLSNKRGLAIFGSSGSAKNGNGNSALGPTDDGPFLGENGKVQLGFGSSYIGWGPSQKMVYRLNFADEEVYTLPEIDAFDHHDVERGDFHDPP